MHTRTQTNMCSPMCVHTHTHTFSHINIHLPVSTHSLWDCSWGTSNILIPAIYTFISVPLPIIYKSKQIIITNSGIPLCVSPVTLRDRAEQQEREKILGAHTQFMPLFLMFDLWLMTKLTNVSMKRVKKRFKIWPFRNVVYIFDLKNKKFKWIKSTYLSCSWQYMVNDKWTAFLYTGCAFL